MANIELDAGSGGSIVRTVQKTVGAETVQIATAAIDVGNHATGTELLVGDANVFMPVHGAAADNDSAAGNPLLVGAKYLASPESDQLGANDVGQLICDINRHLKVVIHGAGGSAVDPSVGLAIDDDGAASVTFSGLHTENYRTDGGGTDTTAALGVVVPGLTGAVSVGSVSITDKTSGTDQPTVVGLNSAVVGAHITDFYTGDDPDDDVVNISAFGLAVPSSSGPVVIDNDSNKLSVDVSTIPDVQISTDGNTVKIDGSSNSVSLGTDVVHIAGRTTIATPSTAKALLVDSSGHLQVDVLSSVGDYTEDTAAATNPVGGVSILVRADASSGALDGSLVSDDGDNVAQRGTNYGSSYVTSVSSDGKVGVLEGWDYATSNAAAHKIKVDAVGSVHTTDVNTYVSDFDTDANDTVNASSYGVIVPSADGPVVVGGDANGLNTKSMAIVQNNISGNNLSGVSQLRVDQTGALHVTGISGGGGGTEYTEDAGSSSADPIGGTSILVRADGTSGGLSSTVVDADGDYIANRGTAYGSSYVTTVSSDGKVGVLQGWDYDSSNPAAQKIKVDSSGSLHVSATGTTSVSGTVQANSQGKFYDRTYGNSSAGSSPSVAQVDVNSYGQITLDTSYEVGRDGTLDNLGITNSEPRVSLSGAIIDETLEDLTETVENNGAGHVDGDVVQLRVNDYGRLYVDVGSPTVDLGATDSTHLSDILTSTQLLDDAVAAVDSGTTANKVILSGAKVHKSSPLIDLTGKANGAASGLYVNDRGALFSTLAPNAQAGLLSHRTININTTYKLVSLQRCSLYSLSAFNMTSSALYLKIYNDPAPTSADTPVFTFPIPANASSTGAGFMWNSAIGVVFSGGMGYRVTTGLADNDTNYPSSGDAIINIGYSL